MNDLYGCMCETELTSQQTQMSNHLNTNSYCHCDLFETQFFKENWQLIQDCERDFFNSAMQDLAQALDL